MPLRSIKKTNVRNRTSIDKSMPRKAGPAVITQIDATAADTIQITFQTRVFANKLPQFFYGGAAGDETVASMTQVSATVVELAFTGDVQGTNLVVEEGDGGIRTPAGGFVPAGVYAIPTFP